MGRVHLPLCFQVKPQYVAEPSHDGKGSSASSTAYATPESRSGAHIEGCSGTHFDPHVVREFLRLADSADEAVPPAAFRREELDR